MARALCKEPVMESKKISEVLDKIPSIISVVTVGRGGVESGLTVSWLSQVSFEPPQIIIAVDRLHYSVDLLKSTKNFVVNLLKRDQRALAALFARPTYSDESKLERIEYEESSTGASYLTACLGYLDCEVVSWHEAGDHLLFMGKVVDGRLLHKGESMTTADWVRYRKSRPKAR
jgi:flavin reductase (DIM6/NTAB) family NADH-FMN oxidoreductase RutF